MASPSAINRLRGLLAACLVTLGLAGCGVNQIPTLEEQAKAAWGEVENQYQRRADLIPNLVETVKGYAAHEKDVLEAVDRARAGRRARSTARHLTDPEGFKRVRATRRPSCPARSAGCWRSSRTIPT